MAPLIKGVRETSELLSQLPMVTAVCLFGSVARGGARPDSDVDVLVVAANDSDLHSVRSSFPDTSERLSFALYSKAAFQAVLDERATMLVHLRKEGRVLFDRDAWLSDALAEPRSIQTIADIEISVQARRLAVMDDLSIFNDNFLICLSRLYGIGRSITLALLVRDGRPEFDTARAFATLQHSRPNLARDVANVLQLRSFHQLVSGKSARKLPFSYIGAERQTFFALDSVRRIAAA